MQQHIRLMHVHLEHLAADEHLGADDASDFRRFDRKILVRALGLDLERMNAALRDQPVHVRDSLRTDGFQFRRRLDRFADGSNTEHLGDLLDDRLNIQCLVRPDKGQSFTSSDIDAAERFQIIADAVYQHSLKIWFIIPFKATSPQRTMRMFCSFMVILLLIPNRNIAIYDDSLFLFAKPLQDQRKLPSLRKRCTAALTFSTVYSISSIVLNSLKLKRIAPSISFGESPIAFSTCEPFAEA